MLSKLTKIAQTACLLIVSAISYDPTVPILDDIERVWDLCTRYGGSMSCYQKPSGAYTVPDCSAMYGCGYAGSAINYDPCPAGAHVSQSVDEKHYRISNVEAYNNDNGGEGTGQF